MRKSAILLVLLLVLGIGGLIYTHVVLTAAQYDVQYTEIASFGDVSAANGLSVSVQTQLSQRLVWNSTYTFEKEPVTQTDFAFSTERLPWRSPYTGGALALSLVYDFSASTTGGSLLYDYGYEENVASMHGIASVDRILRDVASRTHNGERHTERVSLKDYYDYYPIGVDLRATRIRNNNYYYMNHMNEERYVSQIADERKIREAFNRYFLIPVSEEHRVTVEINKDSMGNVVAVSTSQESPAQLSSISVDTTRGIYFSLQTGGLTDTSSIIYSGGGHGIHLLPASTIYDDEEDIELLTLDYENLSTVYFLEETVSVMRIDLSEDESCLNLITEEDGVLFLTVIEIATMAEKQKLSLLEFVDSNWIYTAIYAEGVLFVLLDDARFVLAQFDGDNTCKIVLSGLREHKLLNEESFDRGYYRWNEPFISWNGERLALIEATQRFVPDDDSDPDSRVGFSYGISGFIVEVYNEKSELAYKGIYESSLDALAADHNHNDDRCQLIDSGGLSLNWQL